MNGEDRNQLEKLDEKLNNLTTYFARMDEWRKGLKDGESGDIPEIKIHFKELNGHVADNTIRSVNNKTQIRNLWMIIIAHLALLGTILGLLIHYQG